MKTRLILLLAGLCIASVLNAAAPVKESIIINDATQPVPVTISNSATTEPFQFGGAQQFQDGVGNVTFIFTVPAGKLLVIESLTLWASTAGNVHITHASVETQAGGVRTPHFIALSEQPAGNDPRFFGVAQNMKLYADPSTAVYINIYRYPSDFGGTGLVSISGYLQSVSP